MKMGYLDWGESVKIEHVSMLTEGGIFWQFTEVLRSVSCEEMTLFSQGHVITPSRGNYHRRGCAMLFQLDVDLRTTIFLSFVI